MQKYQANELCQSFGIRNYGVTCYFNTLIQSILSCPVIRQTLVRVRDKYTVKCQVARALLSSNSNTLNAHKISLIQYTKTGEYRMHASHCALAPIAQISFTIDDFFTMTFYEVANFTVHIVLLDIL